jgi:succinoglycan biosynthesis transport protein ExoP
MPDQLPQPTDVAALSAPALGIRQSFDETSVVEEQVDWRRFGHALQRHRWAIVLVTVLGLGAGVAATRLVRPRYMAQGTVWIEQSDRQGGPADRGPIQTAHLLDAEAWIDLLRSYVVLDEVVRELHLYLRPAVLADSVAFGSFGLAERFRPGQYKLLVDQTGKTMTLTAQRGVVVDRAPAGDSLGTKVGFLWVPPAAALAPGATVAFTVLAPRDAARKLGDGLTAEMDRDGAFMRLSLEGADPLLVATILNSVMQRYISVAADLKRAKLVELTKILDVQLQSSERNLHAAENGLETFRVQTITLPTDRSTPVTPGLAVTRDPAFSNFFNIKVELDQVGRDRDALQHLLTALPDSGVSVEDVAAIPAVQSSPELSEALKELSTKQADLRALRYRYTDATPAVQRIAGEIDTLERATIPRYVQSLIVDLGGRERSLQNQVSAASGELRAIPARTIEEARLQREVTIDENLYTTLQQRYEEARLADASSMPDVRILDAAVSPEAPIKNTAPRLILLGLIGGLGLALAGAVFLDRIDPRIRYPSEITQGMGLPILGAVPHLKRPSRHALTSEGPDNNGVIEALRGIRLSLVHSLGASPLVLTITSPGTGDGKSFLSSNLALAFGDAGYRTLLIDGDVRRGALHRLLNGARTPGLTDFLAGGLTPERVVQTTPYAGVSFIGSGTRQHASPELLGSPAMGALLAAMRKDFHVIVVDSPPLGAGIDPYVLGAATGNLLVVLRTGATDRAFARAKLEALDRLPVRIVGAVLNDVPEFGAYYYHYYSYLAGYATQEEGGRLPSGNG